MSEETTAKKISSLLGVSERSVLRRATVEKWPFREVNDQGRGRKTKYFIIENLPADIRNQIIQARESDYIKNTIAPPREDLNAEMGYLNTVLFSALPSME